MKKIRLTTSAGLALALLSSPTAAAADSLVPGSVLVYPSSSTGGIEFTAFSVTNSNLAPAQQGSLGGTTTILLEYVNLTSPAPGTEVDDGELLQANGNSPLPPRTPRALDDDPDRGGGGFGIGCLLSDLTYSLTPADTKTFLGACTNPFPGGEGYLVITATDPAQFKTAWSHNYLLGSEFRVTVDGSAFTLPAIPFDAIGPDGLPTDLDGDGQLDFDEMEYQSIPDVLYIDKVFSGDVEEMALINLTGGASFLAQVAFDVFNDNEQPLSATFAFQCWAEERLADISLVFDPDFLLNNTLHDPTELDVDCDGVGDLETSWARVRGLTAVSSAQVIPDPALLGALTSRTATFGAGRPLWHSLEKQDNGDFLRFGVVDPEQVQNAPPICDAGPTLAASLGSVLVFDGSTSSDPDGTIVRFDWDFGDGNVALDAGPTEAHLYAAPGTYTVSLTVTDDDGGSSTCTTTADVNAIPICDAGPSIASQPGQLVQLDGTASGDPDGMIIQYDWDFGDGTVALDAGPAPSHSYTSFGTFTVTLSATDDDGATSACTTTAVVNAHPLCDAGGPYSGQIGLVVAFDGSGSLDQDGSIVQYDWDFGDGTTASNSAPFVNKSYAQTGTYTLVLTVTDDTGGQSSCSGTVEISDLAPLCDIDSRPSTSVGQTVPFDASGSIDPDGGAIVNYTFDFGDGSPAVSGSSPTVNHVFSTPGVYFVQVTVTDDEQSTATCGRDITVQ